MIELIINGIAADVEQKQFTYNMQVNDMFNFDTKEVSYSETIYLPTTSNNRMIFGFADEIEVVSNSPYNTYKVDYNVNGIPILRGGIGYLVSKRDNYFVFEFKSNTLQLYQFLQGRDIKSLRNLITSEDRRSKIEISNNNDNDDDTIFNNSNMYLLADYGDDSVNYLGGTYYWKIKRTPISLNVDRIFSLVAQDGGFDFSGRIFSELYWKRTYITSSNITFDDKQHEIFTAKTIKKLEVSSYLSQDRYYDFYDAVEPSVVLDKYISSNNSKPYTVKENGYYRVTINIGKATSNISSGTIPLRYGLMCSNQGSGELFKRADIGSRGWDNLDATFDFYAEKNDIIMALMDKEFGNVGRDNIFKIFVENVTFKIERIKENNNIQELVSDLPLIDLFKNIFKIFALTPIYSRGGYHFYTLAERVNVAPIIDWSDKFVKIKEVNFHSPNYGQLNVFKYKKYEDDKEYLQDDYDTRLSFNDKYLPEKKIFSVDFYAPLNRIKVFGNDRNLNCFEFFTKEEKIENGVLKVNYKEKTGRWHVVKRKARKVPTIVEDIDGSRSQSNSVWVADTDELTWNRIITEQYADWSKILEHPKIVTAEFALNELDIHSFDFFSRIYIDKFGCYFLPNKIKYKAGAISEVEMIKIN